IVRQLTGRDRDDLGQARLRIGAALAQPPEELAHAPGLGRKKRQDGFEENIRADQRPVEIDGERRLRRARRGSFKAHPARSRAGGLTLSSSAKPASNRMMIEAKP